MDEQDRDDRTIQLEADNVAETEDVCTNVVPAYVM